MKAIADKIQYLRELNTVSICLRIILAVLCGGMIGMERGIKGRAAGFRTHILVCVGGALTTMTGQYIILHVSSLADPARLGAQVISGIGFLGVGTIITTRAHKVRGLTTAAGLWTSACLGLSIGIGFYEAAVLGTVIVILAMIGFQRIDRFFYSRRAVREYCIEAGGISEVKNIINRIKNEGYQILETALEQSHSGYGEGLVLVVIVKMKKEQSPEEFVLTIGEEKGVLFIEEI